MKNDSEAKLSSSLEDYLEAIRRLENENKVARVRDIARQLSVTMPSVTAALKTLKRRGLVHHEKNSFIRLTDLGASVARTVTMKHTVLVRFLREVLLLPYAKAEEAACRMEHAVDCDMMERMMRLIEVLHERLNTDDFARISQSDHRPDTDCADT